MALEMEKEVLEKVETMVKTAVENAISGDDFKAKFATPKVVVEENDNRHNRSGEKGIMFARFAKAAIYTQREVAQGNVKAARDATQFQVDFLKAGYAKDTAFIAKVDKALEQSNDGGLLVPEIYSDEFIELLYNVTVVKQMGATIIPMEKGNILINKLIGGLTAQYIPEGGAAAFTNIELGRVRLSSKKLMALTAISNDLLRTNSYYADRLVLNDMMEAMAQAMDYAALYGTGGEDAPLGIANTADIQKDTIDAVPTRSDLYAIKALLGKKNINLGDATIGWVIGWDTWKNLADEVVSTSGYVNSELTERGTLLGHKVLVSNQVRTSGDTTDVFFGKWNDYLIGEEFTVEVATDGSTTFTDADSKVINAFTNDFTVYRTIMKHDMKLARGVSFVKYIFNALPE